MKNDCSALLLPAHRSSVPQIKFLQKFPLIWQLILAGFLRLLLNNSPSYFSLLGLIMFAYVFLHFLFNLSRSLQLADLTLVIAGFQWILTPYFSYTEGVGIEHYQMQIFQDEYMYNTVLAYIGYFLGLTLMMPEIKIQASYQSQGTEDFWHLIRNLSIGLFLISFVYSNFFVSLWSWLLLSYLLYKIKNNSSKTKYLRYLAALSFYFFLTSLWSGMFHELFLILTFQLLFLAPIFKFSVKTVTCVIACGVLLINTIQMVKGEYRRNAANKNNIFEKYFSFLDSSRNALSADNSKKSGWSKTAETDTWDRYNQGWLISCVYRCNNGDFHPELLPEFLKVTGAVLIPRFLYWNKRSAGGRDNIEQFTDLRLRGGTSMNISTVGEGYAYFGLYGNMIFHFFLGILFSSVVKLLLYWEKVYHVGIFLIPPIFFLAVRAESDLATGYTPVFKVTVLFALLIFFFFRKQAHGNSMPLGQRVMPQ